MDIFDPEGAKYDYLSAEQYGITSDKTGHWPSRVPETGLLLKGRSHKTWPLTVQGETDAGYKIILKEGRYYSLPVNEMTDEIRQMNEALLKWK